MIGILYLGWELYNLIRPQKIVVGMGAFFKNGGEMISGKIVAMNGDMCVVRNERGDYTVSRFALEAAGPMQPPSAQLR